MARVNWVSLVCLAQIIIAEELDSRKNSKVRN